MHSIACAPEREETFVVRINNTGGCSMFQDFPDKEKEGKRASGLRMASNGYGLVWREVKKEGRAFFSEGGEE